MVTWTIAAAVGVLTGLLSGMGIGGGTLLVLYLTAVLDIAPAAAAGINLIYFLGCAPPSLWFHARGGLIDKTAAVYAAIGGCLAAAVVAWFAPADSPDWLRRVFGLLLLAVGIKEVFSLFHTEKKSG